MSTAIEWTDETWNPVTGCTKVSPGCDHCYAERVTERFHGKGSFERVVLHPERLDKPLHWRKPRKVFVNSMSDLFHEQVPDEFIADVWHRMAETPQHTYQILTKRHARMRSWVTRWCSHPSWQTPLPNVHLGVSVEDQRWADIRIPALLETPAAVRFLSCEPLLGPIDLRCWPHLDAEKDGWPPLDWVIVGGESGPGARPMHPDWARSLRDQCVSAGVPFLFKQWGEHVVHDQMPETTQINWDIKHGNDVYHPSVQWRVGKKAAGRELDGRTWDEYPEVAA